MKGEQVLLRKDRFLWALRFRETWKDSEETTLHKDILQNLHFNEPLRDTVGDEICI